MKTRISIFVWLVSFISLVALGSCGANQMSQAYNLTKCDYSYHSIADVTLSGTNLSRSLSPIALLQLTSLLSGDIPQTLPLQMTLKINVKNPQVTPAQMQGLAYSIAVDDIDLTQGAINQAFSVAAGETQILPIELSVDLATLIRKNSQESILNIARNIAGISSQRSKITLQLRPTFSIAGTSVTSPIAYPVSFYVGGK